MKKEFKRFTKQNIIFNLIQSTIYVILINVLTDGINYLLTVIIVLYFTMQLLFYYLSDQKVNKKLLQASIIICNAIIFVIFYFLLNETLDFIFASLFIVILLYSVFTILQVFALNTPGFVIDGYVDEELAKEYPKILLKKLLIFAGAVLLLEVVLGLTLNFIFHSIY